MILQTLYTSLKHLINKHDIYALLDNDKPQKRILLGLSSVFDTLDINTITLNILLFTINYIKISNTDATI